MSHFSVTSISVLSWLRVISAANLNLLLLSLWPIPFLILIIISVPFSAADAQAVCRTGAAGAMNHTLAATEFEAKQTAAELAAYDNEAKEAQDY